MVNARIGFLLLGGFLSAVAIGCSGGGQSGNPSRTLPSVASTGTASSPQGAGASLRLIIPPPRAANARRKRAYVSPATNSLTFAQNGGTPQTMSLAATSPNCTMASGARTCVVDVPATPGVDQKFTIKLFASTDGTGTPLSAQAIVATIVAGMTNPINAVLGGVVASMSILPSKIVLPYGQEYGQDGFALEFFDASGNQIIGPNYGQENLTDANGNPATVTITPNPPFDELAAYSTTTTGNILFAYHGEAIPDVKITASLGKLSATATLEAVCSTPSSEQSLYASVTFFPNGGGDYGGGGYYSLPLPLGTDPYPKPESSPVLTSPSQGELAIAVDSRGFAYTAVAPRNGSNYIGQFCPGAYSTATPYHSYQLPASLSSDSILSLALDGKSNVFAALNGSSNHVVEFASDSTPLGFPTGAPVPPVSDLSGAATLLDQPMSIAIDSASNLHISNASSIEEFRGGSRGNVAPSSSIVDTAGGLLGLIDTTTDSAGNVYALYAHDNLTEIAPSTVFGPPALVEYARGSYHTPVRVISGAATQLGTYMGKTYTSSAPVALAIDPSGNAYVLNVTMSGTGQAGTTTTVYNDVEVFTKNQNGDVAPSTAFSVTGVDDNAIAVSSSGQVAVADGNGYGISLYTTAGAVVGQIDASGVGGDVFGIAYDSANDLYASPEGIYEFKAPVAPSSLATAVNTNMNEYDTEFNRLSVAPDGTIYGENRETIYAYQPGAAPTAQPLGYGVDGQEFQELVGLGIGANGELVTGLSAHGTIVAGRPDTLGNVPATTAYADLAASTLYDSIAVDAKGSIYAASCASHSIGVFAPGATTGPPLRTIVGSNTKLSCPVQIALDNAGNMYVSDYGVVDEYPANASGNVAPAAQAIIVTYPPGYDNIVNVYTPIAIGPGSTTFGQSARATSPALGSVMPQSAAHTADRTNAGPSTATCVPATGLFVPADRRFARVLPPLAGFVPPRRCLPRHGFRDRPN